MTQRRDIVIVGGGHNALVAAAYLAGAGLGVTLLERQHHLGGAAISAEVFPGVEARLSRYSYLVSLLPRRIRDDLKLDIRLARRRFSSYTPVPGTDRGLLVDTGDADATAASFASIGAASDLSAWGGVRRRHGAARGGDLADRHRPAAHPIRGAARRRRRPRVGPFRRGADRSDDRAPFRRRSGARGGAHGCPDRHLRARDRHRARCEPMFPVPRDRRRHRALGCAGGRNGRRERSAGESGPCRGRRTDHRRGGHLGHAGGRRRLPAGRRRASARRGHGAVGGRTVRTRATARRVRGTPRGRPDQGEPAAEPAPPAARRIRRPDGRLRRHLPRARGVHGAGCGTRRRERRAPPRAGAVGELLPLADRPRHPVIRVAGVGRPDAHRVRVADARPAARRRHEPRGRPRAVPGCGAAVARLGARRADRRPAAHGCRRPPLHRDGDHPGRGGEPADAGRQHLPRPPLVAVRRGRPAAPTPAERWGVSTAHDRILLAGSGSRRGGAVSGLGGFHAAMAVLDR